MSWFQRLKLGYQWVIASHKSYDVIFDGYSILLLPQYTHVSPSSLVVMRRGGHVIAWHTRPPYRIFADQKADLFRLLMKPRSDQLRVLKFSSTPLLANIKTIVILIPQNLLVRYEYVASSGAVRDFTRSDDDNHRYSWADDMQMSTIWIGKRVPFITVRS